MSHALPEDMLPVELPEVSDYSPRTFDADDADSSPEAPLGRAEDWVNVTLDLGDGPKAYRRETNTMPQWAGSCWYEMRYTDPTNAKRFAGEENLAYWMGPREGKASGGTDEQMTERLVSFTDDYGIEMLAELWSHASAHSLPGALWRMYWLRDVVHRSPRGVSRAFELGMAEDYRSHVVAGVPDPPSADEVVRTIDEILAGLYTGDMDIAMERCAAFAHVVALGIRTDYARSAGQDGAVPGSHEVKREAVERRARLPRQAQQMEQIAHDLEAVAAQLRAAEASQQANGGSESDSAQEKSQTNLEAF